MNRAPLLVVPALVLAMWPVSATAGPVSGGRPFEVALTGEAERPDPGDPDGSGTATLRVNPGQQRICYTLTVTGVDAPTAAHIHEAGPDAAGPVVVSLSAPSSGMSSGCVEAERALVVDIIRSPEDYYVNVHNATYPAGALRGQLG